MKRFLVALAALAAVLVAAPAQADEWGPWNVQDAGSVCVRPDFPVSGSGWKVQKAVANWNSVQSDVTFVMGYNEACDDVLVHRYFAEDGQCGATDFTRLWDLAYVEAGVVLIAGADVYLNDNCSPRKAMRKWVIAHELGHAIGLMHGAGDDSVMSPTYMVERYRGVPGHTDVVNLDALYSPVQ